jgi:hypothetical protein
VQNSRYLLYEAQQAHYYGLSENLALASVISNAAETMGMGHRIGYVKEGDWTTIFKCSVYVLNSLLNILQDGMLVGHIKHPFLVLPHPVH